MPPFLPLHADIWNSTFKLKKGDQRWGEDTAHWKQGQELLTGNIINEE